MNTAIIVGAYLRRDWLIKRSYRLSFAIQIVEYVLNIVVFFFVGRLVDQSHLGSDSALRHGYFAFVLIGVTLMNLVSATIYLFTRQLQNDQTTGTLEALLSTPPSSALLVAAGPAYDLLSVIVMQVLVVAFAAAFFGLRFELSAGSILVVTVALAGCVAFFSSVGLSIAALNLVVKRGASQIAGAITGAIVLVGTVYFPASVLPTPLRIMAEWMPFTWTVDILRSSLLSGELRATKLIMLLAAAGIATPLSLWGFRVSLVRARQMGTLAQY